MSSDDYLERGGQPIDNPDEFESDVRRIVDSAFDDYGVQVDVIVGQQAGTYVEVLGLKNHLGSHITIHTGRSLVFYSIDDFRDWFERHLPED